MFTNNDILSFTHRTLIESTVDRNISTVERFASTVDRLVWWSNLRVDQNYCCLPKTTIFDTVDLTRFDEQQCITRLTRLSWSDESRRLTKTTSDQLREHRLTLNVTLSYVVINTNNNCVWLQARRPNCKFNTIVYVEYDTNTTDGLNDTTTKQCIPIIPIRQLDLNNNLST